MLISFFSLLGLFLLLAGVVSLTLGLATPEDEPRIIVKNALKNFWFLCAMIIGIALFAEILRIIF